MANELMMMRLAWRCRDVLVYMQEGEAFGQMYEGGGLVSNESTSANVLAGATLGGGTRVNWWVLAPSLLSLALPFTVGLIGLPVT